MLLGLIAAPATGAKPGADLPAPIDLIPAMVAVPPSAAVRAYVLSLAERPLAGPTAVRLLCLTNPDGGIDDCLADGPTMPRKLTWRQFIELSGNEALHTLDHSPAGLARIQARTTLLRGVGARRLVRMTVTLDPADARVPATRPAIDRARVVLEPTSNGWRLGGLYPGAALRDGSEAQVAVTCRVEADRSLGCRDGRVSPANVPLALTEAFIAASLQANALLRVRATLTTGEPAVGSEFGTVNRWVLP